MTNIRLGQGHDDPFSGGGGDDQKDKLQHPKNSYNAVTT